MFKDHHYDQSIIVVCVRWYLAYGLSLRDLKEMMSERGIRVDHSTIHRWVVRFSPLILSVPLSGVARNVLPACQGVH